MDTDMAHTSKRRCSDNRTLMDYLFMAGKVALARWLTSFSG